MKKIKQMITAYRLGKLVFDNFKYLSNFSSENKEKGIYFKKDSQFTPEYGGTIHSLSFIKDKKWTEISFLED